MTSAKPGRGLVWDLPLRLFHWLLVLSIGLLWLTQWFGFDRFTEIPAAFDLDWMIIHMWLGYWTLGLIIFRLLWGLVGPRHARFASFLPTPRRIVTYLRPRSGTAKPAGHNPLGALMVVLMLGLIGLQAVSGLFASDDIFTFGPLNGVTWLSPALIGQLNAIHHWLFNFILAAIAIHIVAILIYTLVLKQNLVGPMVHGHKPTTQVGHGDIIASSQMLRAALTVAVAAAIVYTLVNIAPLA